MRQRKSSGMKREETQKQVEIGLKIGTLNVKENTSLEPKHGVKIDIERSFQNEKLRSNKLYKRLIKLVEK